MLGLGLQQHIFVAGGVDQNNFLTSCSLYNLYSEQSAAPSRIMRTCSCYPCSGNLARFWKALGKLRERSGEEGRKEAGSSSTDTYSA